MMTGFLLLWFYFFFFFKAMEFPGFDGHIKRKEGEGANKMRLSSLINFFLINLNYIFINYYNNGLLNSNSTNLLLRLQIFKSSNIGLLRLKLVWYVCLNNSL